jgi:hypothetical protein
MIYRQLAHKLRINRGPGRPDKYSERPRVGQRGNWREFTDEDEPTLIEFDEFDQVDLAGLLRIGAIVPHTPPSTPERGSRGKTTGK